MLRPIPLFPTPRPPNLEAYLKAVSDRLTAHVQNTADPHGTLARAKQVRVVAEMPSSAAGFNDGDLVVVHSTGEFLRVANGALAPIPNAGAPSMAGEYDLSTEDGVVAALGTLIEKLGGTVHA